MEKELYTINKEAKRLRDLNKKIWDRDIEDTSYDEELVNIGLLHELIYFLDQEKEEKFEGGQYIHTDNASECKENELRMWKEGESSQEELDNIEDSLSDWWINIEGESARSLIKDNKNKIESIYNLKESVLKILLEKKEAQIIGVHEFNFSLKREVYTKSLPCIQYNNFTFHLALEDSFIESLGVDLDSFEVKHIEDEIDSNNNLDDFGLSYVECHRKIAQWIKR